MFDVDWKFNPINNALLFQFFLLQNIGDIRNGRRTKIPLFDLETGSRNGLKELEVSDDCGVVCYIFISLLLKLAFFKLFIIFFFTEMQQGKLKS